MVGLGGLEPPTSSLSGKRPNRLRYRPIVTVARPSDQQNPRTGREGKRYPMPCRSHKTASLHGLGAQPPKDAGMPGAGHPAYVIAPTGLGERAAQSSVSVSCTPPTRAEQML